MAILKYLVPYTVCVLAIIYLQSDFAGAADTCYFCNSTNATTCSKNEIDSSSNNTISRCNTTSNGLCGGFSYTYNDTVYVERGCNVNCSAVTGPENSTDLVCKSCNDTLCNTFELSGASSSIGISLVSLLSVVVALYSM